MAVHSTINQRVQYVVQADIETPGTPDHEFGALKMGYWSPEGTNVDIAPSGYEVPTGSMHTKEWSQAPISGMQTYADLAVLFNSILCTGAAGGTAPTPTGGDTFDVFSIYSGDASAAYGYTAAYTDDLTLTWDRDKSEVSGQMQAQIETPGVSLAGSPTKLAVVPVNPASVGLWTSTTFAGAYTRVGLAVSDTAAFTAQLKIPNRRGQVWTLDDSQTSWTTLINKMLNATFDVSLVAEVDGADYAGPLTLADWRTGANVYLKILSAPSGHSLSITMALTVKSLKKKEMQGILALDASCGFVADATANKWIQVACS